VDLLEALNLDVEMVGCYTQGAKAVEVVATGTFGKFTHP
jgi:hypothetical protein